MRVAARLEPGGVASGRVEGLDLLGRGAGLTGEEAEAEGGRGDLAGPQGHGWAIMPWLGRGGVGCGSTAVPM